MFWYLYGVAVIFAHIPLVVDILRVSFPHWKLSRIGLWSRYILIVVAPVCGFTTLWQYLYVFLPLYEPDPLHSVTGILHLALSVWLGANATINYYRALLTHPGFDKSSALEDENYFKLDHFNHKAHNLLPNSDIRTRNGDISHDDSSRMLGSSTREVPRNGMLWNPSRGNYCKICGYRVAYMDHHCLYIGRCFGINNFSYFFIGICYGTIGAIYMVVLTAPYFWKCDMMYLFAYINFIDPESLEVKVCEFVGNNSQMFVPFVCGLWLISMMLLVQIILLLSDVSTQNSLKNISKVPLIRFMGERIRGQKYLHSDSRLNVLILSQRHRWYHYLIPVGNAQSNRSRSLTVLTV